MAKIEAYSSVVVTDTSDAGQINAYLTSNQPTTVIYDPNQNTYTPNWSTSNLVITPVVAYNGKNLSLTQAGLSISFQRQEGSGTPVVLTAGESVAGNKLTVSANKLQGISSKLLTYICNVTYTDPQTNVPLSVKATLTYSLISNANDVKSATITGESAFLYDASRKLIGSNTINLTAHLSNVSVTQWQYKKPDGSFVAFPTGNNPSITGATLKVVDTEPSIWINNKTATIKVVTSDSGVYDIHNIVKIYDGVAGTDTVAAVLSNENHLVPVTSNGTVKSWVGAETEIRIYEGGKDVTSQWTINVKNGAGLIGNYDSDTHIFKPTALSVDASYAEFTCTRSNYSNIIKRYTISKQYAGGDGQDAVIYQIEPDVLALNLNKSGVFTPNKITFSAFSKIGSAMVKNSYAGRFIISESTDGVSFSTKYTSGKDEATTSYVPSSNTVKLIKCALYKAGATTTQLDEQAIGITTDGHDGTNGKPGANAVSVVIGNDSEVIPCNTSGVALAAKDISIPFYGYSGTQKIAITCNVGTLPNGVTVKANTPGTTSAGGLLVLAVASGANFGNPQLMSGDITLTFVCNGTNVERKFTWAKNKQASNGQNAVIFQLFSPDGGTIYNGNGSTTLQTMMMSGSSQVTPTKFVWSKYNDGTYKPIEGQTKNSLTVTAQMVDSTSWFKCVATYGGKDYTAYWTVLDISDPVTPYTFATVATFKNGQGEGAIYTRVYRNGEEIDPIRSTVFSTQAPASATSGEFYYHLDKASKTCVLKKYNGSTWIDATEKDTLHYSYRRVNAKGVELDTTAPFKTDRCFYIDPTIINGQMQFRCKVSDTETV